MLADLVMDPSRQEDAPGLDPDQDQSFRTLVLFKDFVSDPGQAPVHDLGIHNGFLFFHFLPLLIRFWARVQSAKKKPPLAGRLHFLPEFSLVFIVVLFNLTGSKLKAYGFISRRPYAVKPIQWPKGQCRKLPILLHVHYALRCSRTSIS